MEQQYKVTRIVEEIYAVTAKSREEALSIVHDRGDPALVTVKSERVTIFKKVK